MPNRYVCSALEELRTFHDIVFQKCDVSPRDQLHLMSLTEEIQTYVNRMEASLGDNWDMLHKQEELADLKAEVRKLRKKKK